MEALTSSPAQPYRTPLPTWGPSPSKRRRVSTQHGSPSSSIPQNNFARSNQDVTTTSLDSLPPEILAIILDLSSEASLIHTSRRLRYCLPSYIHYTRAVCLKALIQLDDCSENFLPVDDTVDDIGSLRRTLNPETQRHLRQAVFSSAWFTERQLNLTHRALLNWTILQCCSWYGENSPSKYQRQRIKYFVERQSAPSSSAVLYLRVPSGGRRTRYVSARQLNVTVSGCPFARAHSLQVLDFGNCIPDDLLRLPLTASKVILIRSLCRPIWTPREDNALGCDRRLLHRGIIESISFYNVEHFHILLSLEEKSRTQNLDAAVVLDLALIREAAVHGRAGMLIRLLKQLWTCPSMVTMTDLDLVSLMNEAERARYPDFQNTVRVLAMEVAAKWKMTEIEKTGQKVHRAAMDWPPRLIYKAQQSSDSQVWFIPRSTHHDVDWEVSLDLPWLPFCAAYESSLYRNSGRQNI